MLGKLNRHQMAVEGGPDKPGDFIVLHLPVLLLLLHFSPAGIPPAFHLFSISFT